MFHCLFRFYRLQYDVPDELQVIEYAYFNEESEGYENNMKKFKVKMGKTNSGNSHDRFSSCETICIHHSNCALTSYRNSYLLFSRTVTVPLLLVSSTLEICDAMSRPIGAEVASMPALSFVRSAAEISLAVVEPSNYDIESWTSSPLHLDI